MDDKFLEGLKNFSIQDMLDDVRQRPTTSRLLTARGARRPIGSSTVRSGANNGFLGGQKQSSNVSVDEKSKVGGNKAWGQQRATSSFGIRPGSSIPTMKSDEAVDFIPDLTELEEEDFAMSVALAPRAEAQRITSLSELDAELNERKAFSTVRNVDLRKLTKFMSTEKNLVDTLVLKWPSHASGDTEESLQEVKNYMYDALFTDVSTIFEEKQRQKGTAAIWDEEDPEDELNLNAMVKDQLIEKTASTINFKTPEKTPEL